MFISASVRTFTFRPRVAHRVAYEPASELPENRARQAILDHLHASPGATCSEAARAAGVQFGSALWHLRRLTRAGLVEACALRTGTVYFPCGIGLGAQEKRRLVLLRRPGYAQFMQVVLESPDARIDAVACRLGVSKSTAARRAAILREVGLLPPLARARAAVPFAATPASGGAPRRSTSGVPERPAVVARADLRPSAQGAHPSV